MGLGNLNPGCDCECNNGCGGSLAYNQSICRLSWTTTGNPVYVQVRFGETVISLQPNGELFTQASGSYSLWIKCTVADELVLVQELDVVGGSCDCCLYWMSQNSKAQLSVDVSGDQWVRGNFVAIKNVGWCEGTHIVFPPNIPFDDWPGDSFFAGIILYLGVTRSVYYRFASSSIRYTPIGGVQGSVSLTGFTVPGGISGSASVQVNHSPIVCGMPDSKIAATPGWGWSTNIIGPGGVVQPLPPMPPPPPITSGALFSGVGIP